MGNYFPVSNPATNYTFTAAGPVTGGDPVELVPGASGDGQAQRATGGGRYAGIAGQDAAPGHGFACYVGNAVFSGAAEGAVAAGDPLAASAVPGRQVRTALPGDDVIGRSFGNAVDGGSVHWKQF